MFSLRQTVCNPIVQPRKTIAKSIPCTLEKAATTVISLKFHKSYSKAPICTFSLLGCPKTAEVRLANVSTAEINFEADNYTEAVVKFTLNVNIVDSLNVSDDIEELDE